MSRGEYIPVQGIPMPVSEYSYVVYKIGTVYYADAAVKSSLASFQNSSFASLMGSVMGVLNSGRIFLKSGTYTLADSGNSVTINTITYNYGIKINTASVQIECEAGAIITYTGTGAAFYVVNADHTTVFTDLFLNMPSGAKVGIIWSETLQSQVRGVTINGAGNNDGNIGLLVVRDSSSTHGCYQSDFYDLFVENIQTGVQINGSASKKGANVHNFFGLRFSACGTVFQDVWGEGITLFGPSGQNIANTGFMCQIEDQNFTCIGYNCDSDNNNPSALFDFTTVGGSGANSNAILIGRNNSGSPTFKNGVSSLAGLGVMWVDLALGSPIAFSKAINPNGYMSNITIKSSNYGPLSTDETIPVSASGGPVTVTLPAANANTGQKYTIIKTDSSGNAVTVTRAGADTIEGATSVTLAAQFNKVTLVADGVSVWYKPGSGNQ